MRIKVIALLGFLGGCLLGMAQPKQNNHSLERAVQAVVLKTLASRPLPHPVVFTVDVAKRHETTQGKIQQGTVTWHYTWFRLTPEQDSIPVFSHTQKINYQRTQPWEDAWKKISASIGLSTVQYAHIWWKQNGGGSPALVDSVRLVWLPDEALEEADTLYHPVKRLDWSDFQGVPAFGSRYGAEIFTSFGFSMEMEVKNHILHIRLQGKCYMIRGISWVKSGNATPAALAHEQLHFDITQRSLAYWKNLVHEFPTYWHPDDWSAAIQQAYLQAFRHMNQRQKQYDAETLHGQNAMEQAKWEAQFKINRIE